METNRLIFADFDKHLLNDNKPSLYFTRLLNESDVFTKYPFTMLGDLSKIEQSPQHHPEGNVWNHTMQVVDIAASRKQETNNPRLLMWSALLHDLGKVPATKIKKGKITAYNHDKLGEKLAHDFLISLGTEQNFITEVSKMVKWHMQVLYVVKDLPFADIENMLSEVKLDDIALLSLCDRLGRGKLSPEKIAEEENNVKSFLQKCRSLIHS